MRYLNHFINYNVMKAYTLIFSKYAYKHNYNYAYSCRILENDNYVPW